MKNITSAILLENLCLTVSRIRSHSSHTSPFSTYAHTHEACPCHSPTDTSLGWADTRFPEYAPQAEQAALLSLTGRQATELRWAEGRLKLCHTPFTTAGGMRHVEHCLSISSINTIYHIRMLNQPSVSKNSSDLFYFSLHRVVLNSILPSLNEEVPIKGGTFFPSPASLKFLPKANSQKQFSRSSSSRRNAAAVAGSCSASNCG